MAESIPQAPDPSVAMEPSASEIARALRAGRCPPDAQFDRFLSEALQLVSSEYWTPLATALRIVGFIERHGIESVLDIGSGAGKFCVAAAAACAGNCRFYGLEQRPGLVAAARELARRFEVEAKVDFIEGTLDHPALPRTRAYYLYNPFGENLVAAADQLDAEAELSAARFAQDIERVRALLQSADAGTFVITYNGFGGALPEGYHCLHTELDLPYELALFHRPA